MTDHTKFACRTWLAVLLVTAAPAYAQLDLLRTLVPLAGPVFDGGQLRRHAEEMAALARLAESGYLDEAVRRAEALVAEVRKTAADSPRSPVAGVLVDSAVTAASLQERAGNNPRALELLRLALEAGRASPGGVISRLEAYSRIGDMQLRLGAFGESMQTYQAILAAHENAPDFMRPLRATAYAGLGKAALEAGNESVAETNLRLAIAHDPARARPATASLPGATSLADAQASVLAAFGRAQELATSIAGQRAVTDQNGELAHDRLAGAARGDVLDVQGPMTDLARLYYRKGDVTSLKRLYQLEFSDHAARAAGASGGGLGPSALREKQYARFGAYLAGLGEHALAGQALGHALRLNARRLAVTATDVPPELLAGPFAARRQLLDLAVSLHLVQKAGPEQWKDMLGDLLQSKGLKSEFLARRARAIGLSKDPEVRRLTSALEATAATGGTKGFARRMNAAQALQARIGKSLPPLTYEEGRQFLDRVEHALQGETFVSVSAFMRFDFAGQRFGAQHYLGAMLHNGKLKVVDLGPAAAIDSVGARFRGDLSRQPPAGDGSIVVLASARAAYDALLRPLIEEGSRMGNFVADLDGPVSLLPFEAFSSDSKRYLIEEGSWRYISSARAVLAGASPRPVPGPSVVLAAPAFDMHPAPAHSALASSGRSGGMPDRRFAPLPQALAEGNAVTDALRAGGADVALYAGTQATAAVLATVRSPRFLHIATHGFFLEEDGTLREHVTGTDGRPYVIESLAVGRSSGLAFAGANGGESSAGANGILYAAQLRQVDLAGTELAVLSACDTSLGAIRPEEGVDSLRQALEIAGARTMVTSLWSVADAETGAMMTDFYKAVGTGAGKPAALRDAKLRLKQRRPHPFYWAPFVVTGMP